jgi:hypothetical protein
VSQYRAEAELAIDVQGILGIIHQKLHNATAKQQSMGSKATYRQLNFIPPPEASSTRASTRASSGNKGSVDI